MKKIKILKTIALTLTVASFIAITPSNASAETWKNSNNNWYYINSTGQAKTGWIQDNGNWYYMWSDGSMATDAWIQSTNGKWYYLDSNGAMACNTTIGNYTLGSDGAWIISNRGAFTENDITERHMLRSDIGQNQRDKDMSNSLSYTNMEFSDWSDKMLIEQIPQYIMNGKIYVSEAKDICIGKVYKNKYMITDIKFFSEHFRNIDCIDKGTHEEIARASSISNYKSSSKYVYDKYGLFSSSANNSSEWEAMRVIIEFEEI
ncbi:hypothetical protein EXM65_18375 [Clostridium botulinum]|uniref:Cell wall-binding protein n=1 Tax=Clostridium botulinum TaxID=1491 RepID=A0A6M0SU61_CLOBO|nr:hypothetical protein [Clostridium botulinum]NFI54711.1 hypothetical protein [Clostridium botulinum]